jgi:hypothetical protein
VSTGNAFISDKLGAFKATADGELMRLLEIEVSLVNNPNAAELIATLEENYGLAGDVFMQYVISHLSEVIKMIDKLKERIIKATGAHRKERFWVGTVAADMVGGIIAQKLGLHDYNMKAIYNWAIGYFSNMRETADSHVVDTAHIMGEFLNENISAYLITDKLKINPITGTHVMKAVLNRVTARYENDNRMLYVSKKDFKDYCVKRQMSIENAIKECGSDYSYKGVVKKRMASGTGVTSPAVEVYSFLAAADLLEMPRD